MTSAGCMSWLHRTLRRNAPRVVFAYLLLCLIMWSLQRVLLYHPDTKIESPASYGLAGFVDVTLKDTDGTQVHAWQHVAREGYPTILFFHGNGGNLAHRVDYFHALAAAGFGVIALDYRGYGKSEGSPSEEGFYQDARAMVEYATKTQFIPFARLILSGESIGTGVAVQMATEYPSAALVLQSPYTSVESLAADRYWWLPVHYLLSDRFDSLRKITDVHMPLLVMHGEDDTIVPVTEGRALFAHANEPKEAVYFPERGHNDLGVANRVDAILVFARKQKLTAGLP